MQAPPRGYSVRDCDSALVTFYSAAQRGANVGPVWRAADSANRAAILNKSLAESRMQYTQTVLR